MEVLWGKAGSFVIIKWNHILWILAPIFHFKTNFKVNKVLIFIKHINVYSLCTSYQIEFYFSPIIIIIQLTNTIFELFVDSASNIETL